jgi:hypothetical protein
VLIGKTKDSLQPVELYLRMANRHGLIAGVTGTGKTLTLHRLAEGFSRAGVSVFAADIKGDLSGIARPGMLSGKVEERVKRPQLESFSLAGNPVVYWDLYARKGVPVRTTISEVGPVLLSRMLELNETQDQVLQLLQGGGGRTKTSRQTPAECGRSYGQVHGSQHRLAAWPQYHAGDLWDSDEETLNCELCNSR